MFLDFLNNIVPKTEAHKAEESSGKTTKRMTSKIANLIKNEEFAKLERECKRAPKQFMEMEDFNLFSEKCKSYPVHYLCRHKDVPVQTLQAVIRAGPEALIFGDLRTRSTPLHIACWNRLPLPLIEALVEGNPQALRMTDVDGNLPLHVAASLSPEDVAVFLWRKHPTKFYNRKRQNVLHCACLREDVSVALLEEVRQWDASQSLALVTDWRGRTPLHHACMYRCAADMLAVLIEMGQRAVTVYDNRACLPYGIARRTWHLHTTDPRVMVLRQAMQKASPSVVVVRNTLQFTLENYTESATHDHAHKPIVARRTMRVV